MASHIIPFPQKPSRMILQQSAREAILRDESNLGAHSGTKTSRHGLHVVTAAASRVASTARPAFESARRSTQAQADRIVAQVEQEIARHSFRKHQRILEGAPVVMAAHTLPTFYPRAETPTGMIRRIVTAMFAFTRTA